MSPYRDTPLHDALRRGASPAALAHLVRVAQDQRVYIEKAGLFSDLLRRDLAKELSASALIHDPVAVVEARCWCGNYADSEDCSDRRIAVIRLLHKRGTKLPRGKQPKPALAAFVGGVAPLLLAFGVRASTGVNSRMVMMLERIASDLGIVGDPRNQLRRIARTEAAGRALARRLVAEAFHRAWSSPRVDLGRSSG